MDEFFHQISREGLEERFFSLLDKTQPNYEQQYKIYHDRLDFELKIINQMGFGLLLIVMDFIAWAKNNGVPVGKVVVRGYGSLAAYSLKITDLDPLKYDLLFERF